MDYTTRGLILRAVNYKESDQILTVLTEDLGKITVSARGARKPKGKYTASSQLLAFSDLTMHHRQGRYYLNEGRVISLFPGLRQDVKLLSIGAYFAELLDVVSDVDVIDASLLSLGLNALHILSSDKKDARLVKAAFEVKLMCESGYTPQLMHCIVCRRTDVQNPHIHLQAGSVHCKTCPPMMQGLSLSLDSGSLLALRHVVMADYSRIYSFTLGEQGTAHLESVAEAYVLTQLERNFKTLDFLKQFM